MELKLFRSRKYDPIPVPCNEGFSEAMNLLWILKQHGIASEIIDTEPMSEEGLYNEYMSAVVPSVHKKFKLRQIFGSRRRSGYLFGLEVPALIVYEEGQQHPIDVYPHEEQGRVITIREYLEDLLIQVGHVAQSGSIYRKRRKPKGGQSDEKS